DLGHRRLRAPALQQPNGAPQLAGVEAVQIVTPCNASLAAGAGVEIDLERQLLSRARRRERQERAITVDLERLMTARERLDRRLLGQAQAGTSTRPSRMRPRQVMSCTAGSSSDCPVRRSNAFL